MKDKINCYVAGLSSQSKRIHWLVHSYMASNNRTLSRQKPRNGENYDVRMLTAFAREQSVLGGGVMLPQVSARSLKFCFVFFVLYSNSLNDWSLVKPVNFVCKVIFFSLNTNH